MAEQKRKPKAAGPRTEVFAMRLDPKLKYLAEIAARKQRRSLANFIEWAIEQALSKVALQGWDDVNGHHETSILDEASKLWDLEPSDRFLKLAENHPDLLTYEEQLIWKAIYEIRASESYKDEAGERQVTTYDFLVGEGKSKRANRTLVRNCWSTLVAYAVGQANEQDVRAALMEIPF